MNARMILLVSLVLITSMNAQASVTIAPPALYLGDDARNGRITVTNTGAIARDISISIRFGYPVSDEHGTVALRFFDNTRDSSAATRWISVYPEGVSLSPGETQVFVIICTPPPDLPTGEYWARPVLVAAPRSYSNAGDTTYAVAISLNYRHGSLKTGIVVDGITTSTSGGGIALLMNLSRTGNAAYLGSMVQRVRSRSGRIQYEERSDIAVYRGLTKRADFNVIDLPPGIYIAEVELNTQRPGNASGDILPATPIRVSVDFTMPEKQLSPPLVETNVLNTPEKQIVPRPARRGPVTATERTATIEDLERALETLMARHEELVTELNHLKSR